MSQYSQQKLISNKINQELITLDLHQHFHQMKMDNLRDTDFTEQERLRYYVQLQTKDQMGEIKFADINKFVDPIRVDDMSANLQHCKIIKVPGTYSMNYKLLKYALALLYAYLLNFIYA